MAVQSLSLLGLQSSAETAFRLSIVLPEASLGVKTSVSTRRSRAAFRDHGTRQVHRPTRRQPLSGRSDPVPGVASSRVRVYPREASGLLRRTILDR